MKDKPVRDYSQQHSLSVQIQTLISELIPQSQQSTVIQALDRSLAAPHNLADLSIREVLHELEDQERLALGRQLPDQPEQRVLLL